jgi:hypothetical protein
MFLTVLNEKPDLQPGFCRAPGNSEILRKAVDWWDKAGGMRIHSAEGEEVERQKLDSGRIHGRFKLRSIQLDRR